MRQIGARAQRVARARFARRRDRRALKPPVGDEQVGGALADIDDRPQALDHELEQFLILERPGELGADLVQQRRAPRAVLQLVVQTRVDDRLPGDLTEAAEQVQLLERARVEVEQSRRADHLHAVDERHDHARVEPPLRPLPPLEIARPIVAGHILDDDESSAHQGLSDQRVVGDHELATDRGLIHGAGLVDTRDDADRVPVHRVDAAGRSTRGPAHPPCDREEDTLHIQRRTELETAVHQQPEVSVA